MDTGYFLCLELNIPLAIELISGSSKWTLPHFLIILFGVAPKWSKLCHKVKYFTLFAQASFSCIISKCNFNFSSTHIQLLIGQWMVPVKWQKMFYLNKSFNACLLWVMPLLEDVFGLHETFLPFIIKWNRDKIQIYIFSSPSSNYCVSIFLA